MKPRKHSYDEQAIERLTSEAVETSLGEIDRGMTLRFGPHAQLVGRVAAAICAAATRCGDETWIPWNAEAEAALEASHHAELVEALALFTEQAVFDPHTHRVSVDEFVVNKARALLTKIGGGQ